jgi:hypothetical protein
MTGALPPNHPFYGGKVSFNNTKVIIFPVLYATESTSIVNWDWNLEVANWSGYAQLMNPQMSDYGGNLGFLQPVPNPYYFHFIAVLRTRPIYINNGMNNVNPFVTSTLENDHLMSIILPGGSIYQFNNGNPPIKQDYVSGDDDAIIWLMSGLVRPGEVWRHDHTENLAAAPFLVEESVGLFLEWAISTNFINPDVTVDAPSWCNMGPSYAIALFVSVFAYTSQAGTLDMVVIDQTGKIVPPSEKTGDPVIIDEEDAM